MLGLQIYESPNSYEVQIIKRSWRERLWSWPWRPWVVTKVFHKPVMYRIGNKIVAHPSLMSQIRDAEQANDAVGTVGDPLNLLLYFADDACRDKWGSP